MKPKVITITLTDSPDCKKCDAQFHFKPPYHPNDPDSPATRAARIALEAIRDAAKSVKSTEIMCVQNDNEA